MRLQLGALRRMRAGLHGSIPRSRSRAWRGGPLRGHVSVILVAALRGPKSKQSRRLAVTQETAGASPVGPPPRSSSSAGRAPARRAGGRGIEAHLDHDALLDPVAQLGRAPVSRAGGRGIEAHLDHDARRSPLGGSVGSRRHEVRFAHGGERAHRPPRHEGSLGFAQPGAIPGGGLGRMPARVHRTRLIIGLRPRRGLSPPSSTVPVPVSERAPPAATRRGEGATPSRHSSYPRGPIGWGA